jgi:integrase
MSRRREPPRLWLKDAERGRAAVWLILDGPKHTSTGCGERDIEQAQRLLADYIKGKFEPPTGKGQRLLVVEAVAAYLEHHIANMASDKSREFGRDTCRPLLQWWSGKTIAQVNGINCRAYVKWRTAQTYRGRTISDQTARHDLKSLRAAIRWYKREVDTGIVVPTVTMPSKSPPRMNYFLTRDELAMRIRAARRSHRTHHVARMLLIGWYTGTRPGAILALRWLPSPTAGWFDLENGVLHRRGQGTRITNKRQPPARIHARLLPHLRRWHKLDNAKEFTHIIRYQGESVKKLRRSWGSVAGLAASLTAERESKRTGKKVAPRAAKDGPHIMRHSCCTWLMAAGVDTYEVSGYTGVSVEVLLEVYGHHHPDFQSNAATATSKRPQSPRRVAPENGEMIAKRLA